MRTRVGDECYALGVLDVLEEVVANVADQPDGNVWLELQGCEWAVRWDEAETPISGWLYERNSGEWGLPGGDAWWQRLEAMRAWTASLARDDPGALMSMCAWLANKLGPRDDIGARAQQMLRDVDVRVRAERNWLAEAKDTRGMP